MKRFFNEEDDNFFNSDEEINELEEFDIEMDDEETFATFISQQAILGAVEEEMNGIALNQELLLAAINLAKDRPFWDFRTLKNQLNVIETIYLTLLEIRSNSIDHDDEEN